VKLTLRPVNKIKIFELPLNPELYILFRQITISTIEEECYVLFYEIHNGAASYPHIGLITL
jgi:hypothetical protein